MADISAVTAPACTRLESFRGRPFNSWGGGGVVGDFEKNFQQALVGRKKLHAAQMS